MNGPTNGGDSDWEPAAWWISGPYQPHVLLSYLAASPRALIGRQGPIEFWFSSSLFPH